MEISIDDFVCLSCNNSHLKHVGNHIVCFECNTEYPNIGGEIPLMSLNAKELIASTFKQYTQFLQLNREENKSFQIGDHPFRNKEELKKLIKAREVNAEIIEDLRKKISPFLDLDRIADVPTNNDLRYLMNWDYLRRDWCFDKDSEHEIRTIFEAITSDVTEEQRDGKVVVLGAGAGRIVHELNAVHEKVFALDNTFTMVGLYHRVLNEKIRFFEINEQNALKNDDRIREKIAYLRTQKKAVKPEYYFWGDSTAIPFANNSVSRVYSIYFTDVLPLSKLLKEVDRVIEPGGDFVHFGPLFYHFHNALDMLSAEEIALAFEKNGFEIVVNRTVELFHHKSDASMMHRVYKNWFFIARKLRLKEVMITDTSVYAINEGVRYSAHGQIRSNQEESEEIKIEMITSDGTSYATTDLILETIRGANGSLNFTEIMSQIEEEYGQIIPVEDREELKQILTGLVNKKVIKIVD